MVLKVNMWLQIFSLTIGHGPTFLVRGGAAYKCMEFLDWWVSSELEALPICDNISEECAGIQPVVAEIAAVVAVEDSVGISPIIVIIGGDATVCVNDVNAKLCSYSTSTQ